MASSVIEFYGDVEKKVQTDGRSPLLILMSPYMKKNHNQNSTLKINIYTLVTIGLLINALCVQVDTPDNCGQLTSY